MIVYEMLQTLLIEPQTFRLYESGDPKSRIFHEVFLPDGDSVSLVETWSEL